MHANLAGVRGYCVTATVCMIATVGWGSLVKSDSQLPWRGVVWVSIGSLMAAVAITVITLSQGVSAKQCPPGSCSNRSNIPMCFWFLSALSKMAVGSMVLAVGCTGMLAWFAIRGRLDAHQYSLAMLQCITGFIAVILIVTSHLSWAIPFLPLTLIPTTTMGHYWQELLPRLFLADLAAMQFLGAYPVSGTQVAVAAFPALLCSFMCIADGSQAPGLKLRRLNRFGKYWILRSVAVVLDPLFCYCIGKSLIAVWKRE
jgi:hypothetical protein